MQIREITVTYGGKLNLGDYNSAHVEISITGMLNDGEDARAATAVLFDQAKAASAELGGVPAFVVGRAEDVEAVLAGAVGRAGVGDAEVPARAHLAGLALGRGRAPTAAHAVVALLAGRAVAGVAAREVAALLAERAHPIAGAVRLGGAVRHGAAPAHAGLARATVAVGRARRLDRAAIEAEAAGRGAVGAEELVAEAHRRGPEVAPRRDAVAGAGARERLLGREPAARGDDRHPRGAHQNRTVEDRVAWSTSPPDENAWPGS